MALSHDLFKTVISAAGSQVREDFPNGYVRYRLDPEAKQIFFEGVIPLELTQNDQGIEFSPVDFLTTTQSQSPAQINYQTSSAAA